MQSDRENEKLKANGDEWDVFGKGRRVHIWTTRPGACKQVKRKYRKRIRRYLKLTLKDEMYE